MERLGARASNTVHPRMRGERPLTFSHVSDLSGSSPHARGTPILLNTPILNRRFIPACAGNALINPFQGRGETGSSPHARGTPTFYRLYTVKSRFIPACAGNARTVAVSALPSTVHPRMRGERGGCLSHNHLHTGSSPHARGTRAWASFIIVMGRFIPACAGNAVCSSTIPNHRTVHPRMRGERAINRAVVKTLRGSSPHARGTLGAYRHYFRSGRFIPACAGNAYVIHWNLPYDSVHPRMRGEREHGMAVDKHRIGSSPHARGTRTLRYSYNPYTRFIPACAGNASSRRSRRRIAAVHPRMRGERRSRQRLE